jgi:hypothetical protein
MSIDHAAKEVACSPPLRPVTAKENVSACEDTKEPSQSGRRAK